MGSGVEWGLKLWIIWAPESTWFWVLGPGLGIPNPPVILLSTDYDTFSEVKVPGWNNAKSLTTIQVLKASGAEILFDKEVWGGGDSMGAARKLNLVGGETTKAYSGLLGSCSMYVNVLQMYLDWSHGTTGVSDPWTGEMMKNGHIYEVTAFYFFMSGEKIWVADMRGETRVDVMSSYKKILMDCAKTMKLALLAGRAVNVWGKGGWGEPADCGSPFLESYMAIVEKAELMKEKFLAVGIGGQFGAREVEAAKADLLFVEEKILHVKDKLEQ